MSVRVSLLAVATLALAGCNFSKAPEEQAACDCKPGDAAAKPAATTTAAAGPEKAVAVSKSATVTRVVHRSRPAVRRDRGERRYYASERSGERDYAGGYGRRYAGVSVSVSESEASSERYRYSETSERYGSAGGSAYGAGSGYASTGGGYYAEGDGRDGRYGPPRPRARTYSLAGKDRDGYLTWPGKVED